MVGCMMIYSGGRGRWGAAPAVRSGADQPRHRPIVPGSDGLELHAQVMPVGVDFDQTPHWMPAPG